MKSSLDAIWMRLSWSFSPELEELIIWKLSVLDIHRFAFQAYADSSANLLLFVWIPANDSTQKSRDELVDSLTSVATNCGVDFSIPVWDEIANEDWSVSWRKAWRPDPVGDNLLILPAWLEVPSEHFERLTVRLDPGHAFGTGAHPTTRLCLEALEGKPLVGLSVADLGCGSGILSLAALKLGAKEVFAVDIDSLAVRATSENTSLNFGDSKPLRVVQGSSDELLLNLQGHFVDLLLCNTLAPVLEDLAPSFEQIIGLKGTALLSGVLITQIPRLKAILHSLGWRVMSIAEKDSWGLLEISRRP